MKKIQDKQIIAEPFTFTSFDSDELRPIRFIETAETDGNILIYNTLTGSMYLLSETEYSDFLKGELQSSEMSALQQDGFLVPNNFDEFSLVRKARLLNDLLHGKSSVKDIFTIYPTTDCNARCFYCFEEGIKTESMTKDTANAVANYIIDKSKGNKVTLRWFGGEPTLCADIISLISNRLASENIPFSSHIVSNALLLDALMARKAVDVWHVKSVQITIDGSRDIYNKTKAYINPCTNNPYETVLQNIETLLKLNIDVHIRINIGPHNQDDLLRMLGEIVPRFQNYTNFYVFTRILNEGDTDLLKGRNAEYMATRKELTAFLEEHGISAPASRNHNLVFRTHNCYADNPRHVAISPTGRLYKCADNITTTPSFGSVFSEDIDKAAIHSLKERIDWPECTSCTYYPYCVNLSKCVARGKACREDIRKNRSESCKKKMIQLYRQNCGIE